MQFGETVFKTLEAKSAGYHAINASGHQVMLSYRVSLPIAKTLTLQEVLSDRFDPELARHRIVLIGTTAPSFNDHRWRTSWNTLSGVEIQAHMVSQILSAVLDQRPLIWWLPKPVEGIWIGIWATVGCLIVRLRLPPSYQWFIGGMAIAVLYGSCFVILVLQAGWIPLVPPVLAFGIASSSLILYSRWNNQHL